MARAVEEEIVVGASLAEVWDLYFEPATWGSWVDEFRGVDSSEGYPRAGSKLVWHSGPNGRGQVSEEVLEHEPRRRHRIRFSDPESEGELTTSFEIEGEGTKFRNLKPPSGSDASRYYKELAPLVEDDLNRLKGLSPPSDKQATYDAWIALVEKETAAVKQLQTASSSEQDRISKQDQSLTGQSDAKAKQLGLGQCTSSAAQGGGSP